MAADRTRERRNALRQAKPTNDSRANGWPMMSIKGPCTRVTSVVMSGERDDKKYRRSIAFITSGPFTFDTQTDSQAISASDNNRYFDPSQGPS
jgi:hypothetical protein